METMGHGQFVLWLTNKRQNKSMLPDATWKQPNSTTTSIGLAVPGAWDRFIERAGRRYFLCKRYSLFVPETSEDACKNEVCLARVQALFTMSPPFLNIEEDQLVHSTCSNLAILPPITLVGEDLNLQS
jgi:hypothetical protein